MCDIKVYNFYFQTCCPAVCRFASSEKPLDEEWKKGAAKELKGKDVEETLTWKTAEV